MTALLYVVAATLINRVRGGGLRLPWLPVPPRLVASVLMLGLALVALPLWQGVAFAVGWLAWATPAWGRWFDLGRRPDGFLREGIAPDLLERLFMAVSPIRNDYGFLHARQWVAAAPLAIAMAFFEASAWPAVVGLAVVPVLIVGAYEAAHRLVAAKVTPGFIPSAEYLTGLVWGLYLAALATF